MDGSSWTSGALLRAGQDVFDVTLRDSDSDKPCGGISARGDPLQACNDCHMDVQCAAMTDVVA